MRLNRTNLSILAMSVLFAIPLILIVQFGNKISGISSSIDSIKSEHAESFESIRLGAINDIQAMVGEEIYIPAYSTLKSYENQKDINFSITLSIRNTDPKNAIIVKSVDFYRSDGEKFKRFITEPLSIRPMATKDFVVSRSDNFGGSGANFYVVWVSDTLVTEPIVEAIMLGAAPHGYSWVSPGRVVKSTRE